MGALDETLALELAEQGAGLMPLDRAIVLVASMDGLSPKRAADLPVDQRDRRLIDACIAAFGSRISFFARCPDCGEGHEADFDLKMLPPANARREVQSHIDGQIVRLRAPTSRAIARAAAVGDPNLLLRACVKDAPAKAEPEFAEKVESCLASAFPLLDVSFELSCGDCGTVFARRFDIAEWLWRELEEVAWRAIDAVDRLARAYGWSENEILALSPERRAMYLSKVAA